MEIKEHIYKSNSLIDCSYKLSLSEQRLISLGCKKLKPIFVDKNITIDEFKILVEANIFDPIEITVPEYKAEFGVKSNNVYGEMKSIVDSLYERSIVYYDNKGKLTKKRWVITSIFDEEIKSVIIKFHPDLLVDLLVFKGQYTKLNYSFLTTVKNSYVGRIYELLRQYLFIKKRYFEISE
ncbi:MAG: replication initiation protein, partial [Clostridium sp.]